MRLPNLVNLALTVLPRQCVQWYQQNPRTTNAVGLDVTTYKTPVNVYGSFQILNHDKFEAMGLDFKREYVTFWVSQVFGDIERDMSGDRFVFAGNTYQVMANEDWFNINGWNASMAVKITP
jgi:hypothetical protein